MATATWTQTIEHSSDATFRVWGKKISDSLQAMSGCVKTGDTGQIDWATVARAGISTTAGYECYYLNDSLHGTAPIYFKIDYGTGGAATRPRIILTVGTSTNGTGTVGGTALTSAITTSSSTTPSAVISATSYLVVREGLIAFLGWCELPAADTACMGFAIVRSCDTDGVPDVTAATVLTHGTGGAGAAAGQQHLRFAATAIAYTRSTTAQTIHIPHVETSTAISGVPQAYLAWQHTPYMQPSFAYCGVLFSEVGFGQQFTATLVGSTSRTYLNVLGGLNSLTNAVTASNYGTAVLWE